MGWFTPVVEGAVGMVELARDEVRSTTAQIELVLRESLRNAGRLPSNVGAMPRRGRPPRERRKGA